MAIDSEVLVIGGGIAGTTAAIAAAREGAHVRLVSAKESTLPQATGLIDLLGRHDGETVADPWAAIPELPASHPYRIVGPDRVRTALALFDEVVPGYLGGHTDRNALVPTHGGTVKPTARYPEAVAPGLASADRETLLVGFETVVDFDAPMAADHLAAAGVPFDADGVTIPFPGELRADAAITRYASLLDGDDEVAVDGTRTGARRALAERVAPHLGDHERVGFPALLGRDRPAEVRGALADELGADVFEVPTGPPSLPGNRLADRLYAALTRSGASVESGNPVVDYETADGDRIDHVLVERNGARVPYAADQYVVATGGLVGKGVDSDREAVHEPVFGCHVPAPADRYDWFADDLYGEHPFARFGVDPDEGLRPRDRHGNPEFDNLRAAGSVLGGYDFAAERSGAGVSIATGHAAGTDAARTLP